MSTNYKIGKSDPIIKSDPGAGIWNSHKKTFEIISLKFTIINYSPHAYVLIGDDATKHLLHYLGNTGSNYIIDLKDMVNDVPSAKRLYDLEIAKVKQFVMTLPVGIHNITTDRASPGYNYKSENWNWFYAVGGYSVWIKGIAKIEQGKNGQRNYRLDYEFKFYDRYNWDKGKCVKIFGVKITDKFMANFHLQGLAKEFNMYGGIKETIQWDNVYPSSHKVIKSGGR